MNVQVLPRPSAEGQTSATLAIADCDIHPYPKSVQKELFPFLEKRWQEHFETYGMLRRQPFVSGPAYPKGQPDAARRDAYPPGGGKPGCDLDFLREQLLDPHNVALGILNPLQSGQGLQNSDFAAAYCRAVNDWQVAAWTSREPRLKASVVIHYEDAAGAVAEIDRRAGDANFAQVLMLSRTAEPLGSRRYWPIYEAAQRAGLPIGVHAFGYGGDPITSGGWASFYIEEMVGHSQASQSVLISLVTEGVFARFPRLKVVLVESGFAWLPPLAWRLDKLWKRLRSETPHLTRLPSEYIRDHVWLTTQPMEEPQPRHHLADAIAWIGWDKLLFATDYPHWDYDDPERALPIVVDDASRRKFFFENAARLYGQA
ncbi:MAG TPA: amidohydrolase family protein [Xanthobacteraceae bacterium]|nr:amidohydrolase family protein [Xanthobacteraceae bacterium]